jgi:hypothetical protein
VNTAFDVGTRKHACNVPGRRDKNRVVAEWIENADPRVVNGRVRRPKAEGVHELTGLSPGVFSLQNGKAVLQVFALIHHVTMHIDHSSLIGDAENRHLIDPFEGLETGR